jgi:hypothetical protein
MKFNPPIMPYRISRTGMLSCSEGKGHTFESCGARQFLVFQRDACALNETVALSCKRADNGRGLG